MGRSRTAQRKPATKTSLASTSAGTPNANYSASDLLAKADSILSQSGDFELAYKFAERASEASDDRDSTKLQALETMGMCLLETGQEDDAKKIFNTCGSQSAVALLYLAQLAESPQEALGHFKAAVDLLSSKIDLTPGSFNSAHNGKDKAWSEQELETRVQISRALVGMTELYLTDLCFEPDAEARCTEYLDMAVRVDAGGDINPEIYSTLASVRLSQQRNADALAALKKSFSIWQPLPPEHPLIPPFESRLSLVRLFVECQSYDEALEILEGLEAENDEDFEVLYLLGLVSWLAGEKDNNSEEAKSLFIDCREVLERFLQVHARKPEEADPEMVQQVQEMIERVEKEKSITMKDVEEQQTAQEGADNEKDWTDDEGDDTEMQ